MHFRERRLVPRKQVKVALRFRPLGTAAAEWLSAESVDFSERGIFFTTALPLRIGTSLEMALTIPSEATGPVPAETRCTGRVIHVKAATGPGGQAGVGVYIERFEPAGPGGA